MTSAHTPTPWTLAEAQSTPGKAHIWGADHVWVGELHYESENDKANAEFIVRACNAHDALLEACEAQEEARIGFADCGVRDCRHDAKCPSCTTRFLEAQKKCRAALELAKGGKP